MIEGSWWCMVTSNGSHTRDTLTVNAEEACLYGCGLSPKGRMPKILQMLAGLSAGK